MFPDEPFRIALCSDSPNPEFIGPIEYEFSFIPRQVSCLDWRETVFTAPQLASPEISDPDTDFDKDGLSVLLEYAIGSDPIKADGGLGVLMVKEGVAGQRPSVEVSHLQQVGLVGLRHSLEISRNLIHWSADSPNFFEGSQQPAQDGFVKATFT